MGKLLNVTRAEWTKKCIVIIHWLSKWKWKWNWPLPLVLAAPQNSSIYPPYIVWARCTGDYKSAEAKSIKRNEDKYQKHTPHTEIFTFLSHCPLSINEPRNCWNLYCRRQMFSYANGVAVAGQTDGQSWIMAAERCVDSRKRRTNAKEISIKDNNTFCTRCQLVWHQKRETGYYK